jgi:uncharacterized protein (TIGR03066 family)
MPFPIRRLPNVAVVLLSIAPLLLFGAPAATAQSAKAPEPAKIIGVWKAVETRDAPGELTVEFTGDGSLLVTLVLPNGSSDKKEGTYTVNEEHLRVTVPEGGKDRTQTATIRRLTENRLITIDQTGRIEQFRRQKNSAVRHRQ